MTEAVNTFTNGLVMDLHPLTTPNNVLTNCLNGTYITYNGNEMILQNDMGNGRVETAKLPAGYIPVGVVSHGGIIYVASYNPIEKMSLIGCFPSPERNISSLDSGRNDITFEPETELIERILGKDYLKESPVRKTLNLKEIHPGDLFNIPIIPEENWYKTELVSITDSNQILTVNLPEAAKWTYYSSKYPGLLAFQFTPYLLKEFNVAYDINKQGELNLNWNAESENETAPLGKVEVEVYYIAGSFKELFYKNELTEAITINNIDLNHQLNVDITAVDPKVQFIGVRVTPMMKTYNNNYARIRSMSKYFEIEVANIDKNIINLNEYRYKVNLSEERNTLLLSYGFNGDLSEGFEIENSYLKVFDLNNNEIDEIPLKKNFGYFTTEIPLDDKLLPNHLYVVLFNVELNNNQQPYQTVRFLYTSTIFNEHYSIAEDTDFGKLHPKLTFTPEIKIENNIKAEYNSEESKTGKLAQEINDISETRGFSYYSLKDGIEVSIEPKFSDTLFELTADHTNVFESNLTYDLTIFNNDELLIPDTDLQTSKQGEDKLNISEGYIKSMIYCENILADIEYKYVWTPLVYNYKTAEENNLIFDESIKHFTNEKFTYLGGYDYPTSGETSGSAFDNPGVAMCGLATISKSDDSTHPTVITSEGELKNTEGSNMETRHRIEMSSTSRFGLQNNEVCKEIKGFIVPTLLAYKPSRYANNRYMEALMESIDPVKNLRITELNYWKQNYNGPGQIVENDGKIYGYKIPELTDEGNDGSTNIPVMLQIKNLSDVYVPINVWVVVNCTEYNQGILQDQGGFKFGKTVGDLIFYILNQIYVRKESSEVYKEGEKQWVVDLDSIQYIKRYTSTIDINILTKWSNGLITKIDNKSILDLLNLASSKGINHINNIVPVYTLSDTATHTSKDFEIIQYENTEYISRSYTTNLVGIIKNSDNLIGVSDLLSGRYAYVNKEGKLVTWDNNAAIYDPGIINYDLELDIIFGNYDFANGNAYSLSDFKLNNGQLYLNKNTDKFAIEIRCAQSHDDWFTISGFNRNATLFEGLKLVD